MQFGEIEAAVTLEAQSDAPLAGFEDVPFQTHDGFKRILPVPPLLPARRKPEDHASSLSIISTARCDRLKTSVC